MYESDTVSLSTLSGATTSCSKASRQFAAELACLGLGYGLSWAELGFLMHLGGPNWGGSSLLGAMISRVFVGVLILGVARRSRWARVCVIALGAASAVATLPLLPAEWAALPSATVLTAAIVTCKLAGAVLLLLNAAGASEPQ